jgi:protein-disulfide isomerase
VGWCANQRGKFKPVYEAIFENQESLKPGMPVQLAAAAGLDEGEIKACAASSEAMAAVTRDLEEGGRLDVQSTPTFFINGYRVEGALPLPVWSGLIERLSAPGQKTGKP